MEIELHTVAGDEKVSFLDVMKIRRDRRAVMAVVPAMTLAILGGSLLPVAWGFSVTGIICGVMLLVVVGLANTYTCDLLLRQAYVTGTYDYESLALMIGGPWWKLTTEISIMILLLGTLVGQTAQIGEVGRIGLIAVNPKLPDWIVGSSGRMLMIFGMILIVAPLCLGKQLRQAKEAKFTQTLQLEYAGVVGTAIVIWLVVSVLIKSSSENLPAIRNRQFPLLGFNNIGDITQAVSIFGFAFEVQPNMMPFLREVPEGLVGVKIVSYSMRIVVLINSFAIFFLVGFFGAATYGKATESNILENEWLGGGIPQGILNLSMAAYLCLSCPTIEFPTRHTINGLLPESFMKHHLYGRQLMITGAILIFGLTMALLFPSSSGNVLVVTGATGVCMVSYLIPVVNHFLLYSNRSLIQREAAAKLKSRIMPVDVEVSKSTGDPPEITSGSDVLKTRLSTYRLPQAPGLWPMVTNFVKYVITPAVVLAVGLFCSVAALTTL